MAAILDPRYDTFAEMNLSRVVAEGVRHGSGVYDHLTLSDRV